MSSVGKSSRPATWGNNRRGKAPEYKYSTLEEIYDEKFTASTLCNVYGVVADLKEPSKSRGSDYFALVFIVDKTSQQPLKIRTFHRDSNFFPTVHLGDIIRFHRLKVYKPSSDITDVLLMSTKGWSWVLWRKSPFILSEDGISSSESYTLLDSDKEIVEELRAWREGMPPEKLGRPNGHIKNKRLSNVKHGDHFALLCQVIFVKKVTEFHLAIKVWDGTKPTVHFELISAFSEERDMATATKDIPTDYIVDVSIHDDHVDTWNGIAPSQGSFVLFHDLHAWPNPDLSANAKAGKKRWGASELVLHSGSAYGRGVKKVETDEAGLLPEVMRDIGTARAFLSSDNAEKSQGVKKNTLDLLQVLHDEVVDETGVQAQPEDSEDVVPQCSYGNQANPAEDYVTAASSLSSEATPTDTIEESQSLGEIRCLQESATVVTGGDGIPQKLTLLKELENCSVPLQRSKFSRVRVQIDACGTPEDSYVKHFCPVTGIFFKATNSGEPLTVSDEVGRFVRAWRKVRGIDGGSADANTDDGDGHGDVPNSQWDIPESVGVTRPINIKRYDCEKDGSTWESIETEDHVTRKRKLGEERFTIMYKCSASPDYGSDSLRTWGATYNRVIRHVPLDLQLSEHPPPVAFQNGVFYYSCPAYAVKPTVPTLKQEAETFNASRVTHAMGTPALVPRLMLSFTLKDGSGELEKVWLMGKNAVDFFGITPQEYLLNEDGCRESLKQMMTSLIDGASWVECIIEKKSRQRKDDSDEPFYVYSICNTKIKE